MNHSNMNSVHSVKHISTYGLAIFLFLTPFEYPLADLISVSPLRIVGILSMLLATFDIIAQKKIKIDFRIKCVILWLTYGLITFFWVVNKDRFQLYYFTYLNNALMFLLFSLVSFTEYETRILKRSVVFGVTSVLLYMQFFPNAVRYSNYQHRLTLNAGKEGLDQNYLAALMLVSFGIVLYNLINVKQSKIKNIFSVFFCIAVIYCVILTGSRSGLIALFLITLLCINTSWKTILKIGLPTIIAVYALFTIFSKHIPAELYERFSLSAMMGKETESGSRLIIWKKALESLKNLKWLFGYGVGASQTVVGNIFGTGKEMAIHNHYLALIVETGILGFFLINYPIFRMLKELRKSKREIFISFVGIAVMAFFLDVLTTKFFWSALILMSTIYSSVSQIKEEKYKEDYANFSSCPSI